MPASTLTLPGTPLGPSKNLLPGPGTHLHNTNICASLAGMPSTASTPSSTTSRPPATISITHRTPHATSPRTRLPAVGSVVLARVTRLSPRQATVAILAVGNDASAGTSGVGAGSDDWAVCAEGAAFQGLIRVQDVRATEKDKVRIVESFRPGDVVRAVVISLGDQSSYYLSTASNALGVVMATSEAGNDMVPVSWREFRDPVTGTVEVRKVAKPT